MTPKERVQEWAALAAHFQHETDLCLPNPDGEALRAIYLTALASAREVLEAARAALVAGKETTPSRK